METSAAAVALDLRLKGLVQDERKTVAQFVLELAALARDELHRELGYESLFYYCQRQLGLPKSSCFRRTEAARLVNLFPPVAEALRSGSVSLRSLVALREVLNEHNYAHVLARAGGLSEDAAVLLALELKPRPVPSRDVVRSLPAVHGRLPAQGGPSEGASPAAALAAQDVRLGSRGNQTNVLGAGAPPEMVKPLTPELRRLSVTVSADFVAELEQVRSALSHAIPDGDFERVVRAGFALVLERDRRRKGLVRSPRLAKAPHGTPGQHHGGAANSTKPPCAADHSGAPAPAADDSRAAAQDPAAGDSRAVAKSADAAADAADNARVAIEVGVRSIGHAELPNSSEPRQGQATSALRSLNSEAGEGAAHRAAETAKGTAGAPGWAQRQPRRSGSARYVPHAVKRVVWQRDGGRCCWPMADGKPCGSTKWLEFDHVLEVALGGRSTPENLWLLCRAHNLRKAELNLGKALMAQYRKADG